MKGKERGPAGSRGKENKMIRKAEAKDLDAVENLFRDIHQAEESGTVTTGWRKGIYPTGATARAALARNDLFVLEEDGRILGSGIINQLQEDAYRGAGWKHQQPDDRVCVLHTLVISPAAQGKGYGRAFVRFYEAYALEHGWTELRIDTNERNRTARAMYGRYGYQEIGIVPTTFNGIPGVNLVLLEKSLAGQGFRPMRRFKQEISREVCIRILETEKRGVLSMLGDFGYPYGIPMNHWYNPEDGKIYFHGAKAGHKIDAIARCDKVSYCVWDAGYRKEGEWALNVNSVIVFGRIRLVTDEEKARMIGTQLYRKFSDDEEALRRELQNALPRVQCLELTIDHMSGKLVNES